MITDVMLLKSKSYVNSKSMCLVCYKPFTETPENQMTTHHIRYTPEVLGYVHIKCKELIDNKPIDVFIQFEPIEKQVYELYKKEKND